MPRGATPLYTLPHNIEVMSEYTRWSAGRVYVRVTKHPLFPGVTVDGGGRQLMPKSRAVMTSVLGRALTKEESVHHIDGNSFNDEPHNLELISQAAHNTLHKTGSTHTDATRTKISAGLRRAWSEEGVRR